MIRLLRHARRLLDNQSGNVLVIFAGSLALLTAAGALALDTASMFLTKRTLQGVADAAALAAAANPTDARRAALSAILANGRTPDTMASLALGIYDPDPAAAATARFSVTQNAVDQNAAQITVVGKAPSIFSSIISSRLPIISAKATAARINLAAFTIGSRLASEQGGLANTILSGLAGADLNLSIADYNGLISSQVDARAFLSAMRTQVGVNAVTFDEVLATHVTLPQAVAALANAVANPEIAAKLRSTAARLPGNDLPLGTLFDLGPLGERSQPDPTDPIQLDAFSMLRAFLEVGGTHQAEGAINLTLPGITSSQVTVVLGQRAAHSPWLAIGKSGQVEVHTAQARILIDTSVVGNLSPELVAMNVPLYVDLGEATANLAAVSCAGGRNAASVSLDVTPSIGTIAIGTVDRNSLADFSSKLSITPAQLIVTPFAKVTGISIMKLSGSIPQRTTFSSSEIASHAVHTTTSTGTVGALVNSLAQQIIIQGYIAGLPITGPSAPAPVVTLLTKNAPALDQIINLVSIASGVRLGQADTWIDGVRCGTPIIVL